MRLPILLRIWILNTLKNNNLVRHSIFQFFIKFYFMFLGEIIKYNVY